MVVVAVFFLLRLILVLVLACIGSGMGVGIVGNDGFWQAVGVDGQLGGWVVAELGERAVILLVVAVVIFRVTR